jgi:hypothetical protein
VNFPATDAWRATRVPPEFRGLARVFLQEVAAVDADAIAAIAAVNAMLRRRLTKNPHLRREQVREIRQAWERTVPTAFLFERQFSGDHRRLLIAELRISATGWHDDKWEHSTPEQGLSLCALSIDTRMARLFQTTPRASVSMHALGRWFQRTGSRDHDQLVRDLRALATFAAADAPPLADEDAKTEVTIACPTGKWVGKNVMARHARSDRLLPMFACRTYKAAESMIG